MRVKDIDRYKRTVAEIILPDGRNLNREIVRAGFAWWYQQYARRETVLRDLENEARAAKRGSVGRPEAGAAVGVAAGDAAPCQGSAYSRHQRRILGLVPEEALLFVDRPVSAGFRSAHRDNRLFKCPVEVSANRLSKNSRQPWRHSVPDLKSNVMPRA